MADRSFTPPPRTGGIARGLARGKPVVKPKNLRGTMLRLWKLTRGSRKGLGWILILSALSSAASILSPLVIGGAVTAVDCRSPAAALLALLDVYKRQRFLWPITGSFWMQAFPNLPALQSMSGTLLRREKARKNLSLIHI